jgi:hypothetical protein
MVPRSGLDFKEAILHSGKGEREFKIYVSVAFVTFSALLVGQ